MMNAWLSRVKKESFQLDRANTEQKEPFRDIMANNNHDDHSCELLAISDSFDSHEPS